MLKDKRLRYHPFFNTFDRSYLKKKQLPKGKVFYRNSGTDYAIGRDLIAMIEELSDEVHAGKKTFTHFNVITERNFNFHRTCGILIVKCKYHPFIIKLFIESPETFTDPNCKGFEPVFMFPMGGGVNRHLSGFTRIKNLESVRDLIAKSPAWSETIDTPRKWFWCSKKQDWLKLTGYNFPEGAKIVKKIPSTYAIVADAIEAERTFSVLNKEDREMAMAFCNYIENRIDPHIDNFLVEKGTGKIVLIDTEHFPTIVGLHEKVEFKGYADWYMYLMGKCVNDWFFWSPNEERHYQENI